MNNLVLDYNGKPVTNTLLVAEKFDKEHYKKQTIFLSGKVTGLWRPWVVAKFLFFDLIFTGLGYEVKNPVKFTPKNFNWNDSMTLCLSILSHCDSIFMLPGWLNSPGANKEFREAAKNGLQLLNDSKKIKYLWYAASNFDLWDSEIEGSKRLLNDLKML
jgi:hypothetical protein